MVKLPFQPTWVVIHGYEYFILNQKFWVRILKIKKILLEYHPQISPAICYLDLIEVPRAPHIGGEIN